MSLARVFFNPRAQPALSLLLRRGSVWLPSQCRGYAKKKRRTRPAPVRAEDTFKEPIRTAEQLKKGIEYRTGPIVLDCTWFMPNDLRKPFEEFQKEHIPGARFFDLDAICDLSSPYPHMLPTPEAFAQAMGMSSTSPKVQNQVCIYDCQGMFSAPRVWWTLQAFGHKNVGVLNGGLPAWKRAGGELETGPPKEYKLRKYPVPELDQRLVRSFEDVTYLVGHRDRSVQIIDARSEDRFFGRAPEPRPGLESGHIPGSLSMPFPEVIDSTTGELKDAKELQKYFRDKLGRVGNVVTSCGTGVTASILFLALAQAGYDRNQLSLYDGSWTEWASRYADQPEMRPKRTDLA